MPRYSPLSPIFDPKAKYGKAELVTAIGLTRADASIVTVPVSALAPTTSGGGTSLNLGTSQPICVCRYLDDYLVVGYILDAAGTGSFISVINISDPDAPFVEGSSASDTDLRLMRDVCVVGDHAFTASGGSTSLPQVASWDLSDVTNPTQDDKLSGTSTLRSICTLANDANYVAVSRLLGDDFYIISVADPTNISIAESITNNDYLQGVLDMQPIDDYIILNSATDLGTDAIVTINVTNPLVATIETNKLFEAHVGQFANGDLLIDGAFGYVVGNAANGGLHFTILDLADPTNVAEEGYVFSDVVTPGDGTPMVLAKEPGVDTVYVLDIQRIYKFDVSTKTAPTLATSYGPNSFFGFSLTATPHQEAVWAKDRIYRVGSLGVSNNFLMVHSEL